MREQKLWILVVVGALIWLGAIGLFIVEFSPETMPLQDTAMVWYSFVVMGCIGLGIALMTTGLAWIYFFASVQKKAVPFFQLVYQKTDLVSLIQQVISQLAQDRRFEPYQLLFYSQQPSYTCEVDRAWFGWALRNLLLYVMRHNPAETEIRVTMQTISNREVLIKIRNNGQSLSPSVFRQLFDSQPMFEQELGVEGSSWSMTVADQLIVAHGGELNMASGEGTGTQITIHLQKPIKEKSPDLSSRGPGIYY